MPCLAHSRCLIDGAFHVITWRGAWHVVRVQQTDASTVSPGCPRHLAEPTIALLKGDVPAVPQDPLRAGQVQPPALSPCSWPALPAPIPTCPSHLWLTPASFGFDFSLVWFCFVCYHLLFYFLFPIFCFPAPSPPIPPPLPAPTFSPPPIEPSAPPQDVKCVSTRSTAILVSWRPPPPETHNGALVSYSVHYRPLGSEDPQPKEVNGIPPTTTQILLEALDKWTEYRITTVAHTEVGPGPESSPVVIRTDEDGKHRARPGTPAGPSPSRTSAPSGSAERGWLVVQR